MSAKRPPSAPKKPHPQVEELKLILRSMNFPFVEELRFHPERMWRFDLAIPSQKIAIEYQGHGHSFGAPKGEGGKARHVGRHASVLGMAGDCEKFNAAASMGWTVICFTAVHFNSRSRRKHNLQSPYDTIKAAIMRKPILKQDTLF